MNRVALGPTSASEANDERGAVFVSGRKGVPLRVAEDISQFGAVAGTVLRAAFCLRGVAVSEREAGPARPFPVVVCPLVWVGGYGVGFGNACDGRGPLDFAAGLFRRGPESGDRPDDFADKLHFLLLRLTGLPSLSVGVAQTCLCRNCFGVRVAVANGCELIPLIRLGLRVAVGFDPYVLADEARSGREASESAGGRVHPRVVAGFAKRFLGIFDDVEAVAKETGRADEELDRRRSAAWAVCGMLIHTGLEMTTEALLVLSIWIIAHVALLRPGALRCMQEPS